MVHLTVKKVFSIKLMSVWLGILKELMEILVILWFGLTVLFLGIKDPFNLASVDLILVTKSKGLFAE